MMSSSIICGQQSCTDWSTFICSWDLINAPTQNLLFIFWNTRYLHLTTPVKCKYSNKTIWKGHYTPPLYSELHTTREIIPVGHQMIMELPKEKILYSENQNFVHLSDFLLILEFFFCRFSLKKFDWTAHMHPITRSRDKMLLHIWGIKTNHWSREKKGIQQDQKSNAFLSTALR